MKIRTDFATNSSSSSFVAYTLTDSEFCKYLSQQMQKNHFSYEEFSRERVASYVTLGEDWLDAHINCCSEYTNLSRYYMDTEKPYGGSDKATDIRNMSKKFLDVIHTFIPFEKVDDLGKLYDAFVDDLSNGKFTCDVFKDYTDERK